MDGNKVMMHFIVEKQRTLRLKSYSKSKELVKLSLNTYHLYYYPLVQLMMESVGIYNQNVQNVREMRQEYETKAGNLRASVPVPQRRKGVVMQKVIDFAAVRDQEYIKQNTGKESIHSYNSGISSESESANKNRDARVLGGNYLLDFRNDYEIY